MALDRFAIATQLREDIAQGRYAAGDKLASYRQLAESFGAAPNTVGEAVRLLAAEGLVRVKPSSPAVVCSPEEAHGARSAAVGEELARLRDELRDLRTGFDQLEQRISEVLDKLEE